MDELPEKYLAGLKLFNEQEFFEAHDELEELWSELFGEPKRFVQGLIQASVALFHFGNENLGGARKLYIASREKLERYPETYMGIEVWKFIADLDFCFLELVSAGDVYPQDVELRAERIPLIHFAG